MVDLAVSAICAGPSILQRKRLYLVFIALSSLSFIAPFHGHTHEEVE